MSAIGPGDWVECVESWKSLVAAYSIEAGTLYVVAGLFEPEYSDRCAIHGANCHGPVVVVAERDTGEGGYCIRQFRPIYRPSVDLIEQLKQPAPADPVSAEVRRMLEASVAQIGAQP